MTHLTPKQLSTRWACSTGWLANMRSAGRGPAYVKPSPNRVLYPLAVIEAYEADRTVEPIAA